MSNLIHLKAFHDTLNRKDLVQAMGQLNLFATSDSNRGKRVALTILTTYFPLALSEEMKVYKFYATEKPWLFRIQGEEEAYLFITSRVDLEEEGFEVFLPFRTEAQVRKEGKGNFGEMEREKGGGVVIFDGTWIYALLLAKVAFCFL